MALDDINWGAVVYGAGIATAIVAFMPEAVLFSAFGHIGGFAAAATIGGVTGEFLSDLTHKCTHAAKVLAGNSSNSQAGHAI